MHGWWNNISCHVVLSASIDLNTCMSQYNHIYNGFISVFSCSHNQFCGNIKLCSHTVAPGDWTIMSQLYTQLFVLVIIPLTVVLNNAVMNLIAYKCAWGGVGVICECVHVGECVCGGGCEHSLWLLW